LRRADQFGKQAAKSGLVSTSEVAGNAALDNPLIRFTGKVGEWQETKFRMMAFMRTLERTGSFDQAERMMKTVFYDYSDLSAFERDVLRRVIPFYTWMRHNIPRMFQTVVTEPTRHFRLAQTIHRIEQGATGRMPPDDSGIPDWIKDNFGIILSQDSTGKYFMKMAEGVFPMFDFYKLWGGVGVGQVILNGVTPFAKFPIEQLMNKSLFTKQELERFPGEPTRGFTLGRAGFTRRVSPHGPLGFANLIFNESALRDFFRLGKTAANLMDDMLDSKNWLDGSPTLAVAAWDLLLGRGMVVDPERTRAAVMWKRREMLQKLGSAERFYERTGNTFLLNEIRKRRINFLLQFGGEGK
jgi:hypothetical protein